MSEDALAYVERWEPTVALSDAENIEIVARKVLARLDDYDESVSYGLSLPQEELPVIHRFGPGLYIREMYAKAGMLISGTKHKGETANFILKGSALVHTDDGPKKIQAPFYFVSKPGAKWGVALEDLVWQNIFATELTDIDEIESVFLEKNEQAEAYQEAINAKARDANQVHRDDYLKALHESGFTQEQAVAVMLIEHDRIDLPLNALRIAKSQIEGVGLFATAPFQAGSVILPARVDGKRTQAGRYVNHSKTPNAYFHKEPNGDLLLIAAQRIPGCIGGNVGTEITIDYRQPLAWLKEDLCRLALAQQR